MSPYTEDRGMNTADAKRLKLMTVPAWFIAEVLPESRVDPFDVQAGNRVAVGNRAR
jgi:hypothetical protein